MTRPRSVLITGCSSGFGKLTARTMARSGYHVYATVRDIRGRNANPARELREWALRKGAALEVLELDVTSEESVNGAVQGIIAAGGEIGVVVNNAGITAWGPSEAFAFEQVLELYNTNVFGPWRVNKAVLPHMRERGCGLIVHITSVVGRVSLEGGLYPASKWAAEGLGENMARELRSFGVDLVLLEPGAYPTEWIGRGLVPAASEVTAAYRDAMCGPRRRAEPADGHRIPEPQEVADEVLRLAALPNGQRPLRTVVGHIFTEGVAAYNAEYERMRLGLIEALKRSDQATPWLKR